jgi:HEAT repeat protein
VDFALNIEQRIEELIKELSNPGKEALQASTTLSEIGAIAVLRLVQVIREEKDDYVRKLAALSLGRIGQPAMDPLLESMRSNDPEERRFAIEALSHMRSEPRVLGAIFQARKDPNDQVRQAAWRALERLPPEPRQRQRA